jgi:hypothetical protein
MAIDTSTLEATLQTKFDNVTDPKEMLLLGKAYEATVGGIAVSDIEDAGAAQVATINSVATSTFKTVGGTSILGTGDIATLPSQTGHSGEVLTTDGTTASWGAGSASSITMFKHTSAYTCTESSWDYPTAWVNMGAAQYVSVGGQVAESGGVFTFPETGVYQISGSLCNVGGNSNRRFIFKIDFTQDGGSNWYEAGRGVSSRADVGGANYDTSFLQSCINVTDTANVKVRFATYVEHATGSSTIGVWDDHSPIIFIKLREAY